MFRPTALALLVLAAAVQAPAQTGAPERGALLYETHCIACHTEQVHWRDKRLARDWDGLRGLVRHWQDVQGLHWSEDDVTAVATLLNERYYGFTPPSRVSRGPAGSAASHAERGGP